MNIANMVIKACHNFEPTLLFRNSGNVYYRHDLLHEFLPRRRPLCLFFLLLIKLTPVLELVPQANHNI